MPPVQRASARRTQRHRNTWVRTETPPPPWAVITAWFFAHWKGNTPKCQAATKLKDVAPWKKRYDKPRQLIKKQRFYFANKDPYSQSCGFSSSQVWIWGLYHRESWALKNQCFWTVVLEKTLESPLNCKEIKLVNHKGNQSWIFIDGLMLMLQYFGHLMRWVDSLEKTPMLAKIEGRRRRGWQRMKWLDSITDSMDMSEQALGVGDGQGSLACYSPWGHKELDTTERLNWLTELKHMCLCSLPQ